MGKAKPKIPPTQAQTTQMLEARANANSTC